MADRKISDLTALTTPATGDLIPIVDISEAAAADKNKSITVQELFQGIPGNVGIGLESPNAKLEVRGGTIRFGDNDASANSFGLLSYGGNTGLLTLNARATGGSTQILFNTSLSGTDSEAASINSNGRLLVGTSTARTNWNDSGIEPRIQIEGAADDDSAALTIVANSGTTNSDKRTGLLVLGRTRGTAIGSNTAVVQDDAVGMIEFKGNDGTSFTTAATIKAQVDGSIGADDMPGRLVFSTTADGSASPTERMQIDSSGNVGIGTTNPGKKLEITPGSNQDGISIKNTGAVFGALDFDSNRTGANQVLGDLRFLWNGTAVARVICESGSDTTNKDDGHLTFYTASAGTATERARIDSSGRLLVGRTVSTSMRRFAQAVDPRAQIISNGDTWATGLSCINYSTNGYAPILSLGTSKTSNLGAHALVTSGQRLGVLSFSGSDGAEFEEGARIEAQVDGTPGTNDMPGRLLFFTTPDGSSNPTERMRLDHNGNLFTYANTNNVLARVGTTGTGGWIYWGGYGATTTSSGTQSFGVYANGNVVNTNNSYGQISDIKLKENIVDASSQWDDLKGIQVRNFNFKEGQTHTQIGVIAQEVELVSPGLVYEAPDHDEDGNALGTVTKGVNYSVLYMKAVKALQEAMERIETLEAKVAALEAG